MSDTQTVERPDTGTDLAIIGGTVTALTVFGTEGGVDAILGKIRAQARAVERDISTPAGRAALASLAYKIARSKTVLDGMGKELGEQSRIALAEQTERDRVAAAAKAEADRKAAVAAAEETARRIFAETAERERQRIAAAQAKEAADIAAREANKRHRTKINNEALADLVSITGISQAAARAVITAIASSQVRHARIDY